MTDPYTEIHNIRISESSHTRPVVVATSEQAVEKWLLDYVFSTPSNGLRGVDRSYQQGQCPHCSRSVYIPSSGVPGGCHRFELRSVPPAARTCVGYDTEWPQFQYYKNRKETSKKEHKNNKYPCPSLLQLATEESVLLARLCRKGIVPSVSTDASAADEELSAAQWNQWEVASTANQSSTEGSNMELHTTPTSNGITVSKEPRSQSLIAEKEASKKSHCPTERELLLNWAQMPLLQAALESPQILKVGFGMNVEVLMMKHNYGVIVRGALDVGVVAGVETPGMQVVCQQVLGIDIHKDSMRHIQTSDWSVSKLTKSQIEYAATDAFLSLSVYNKLKVKINESEKIQTATWIVDDEEDEDDDEADQFFSQRLEHTATLSPQHFDDSTSDLPKLQPEEGESTPLRIKRVMEQRSPYGEFVHNDEEDMNMYDI